MNKFGITLLLIFCLVSCQQDNSQSEEFATVQYVYTCNDHVMVVKQSDETSMNLSVYKDKELILGRLLKRKGDVFAADSVSVSLTDSTILVTDRSTQYGTCTLDPAEAARRSDLDTCYYITDNGSLIKSLTQENEQIRVWLSAGSYQLLDTILPRTMSASGDKYELGDIVFWSKGYTAMLIYQGVIYGHCVRMWPDEIRDESSCRDEVVLEYITNALSADIPNLEPRDRRFASEWIDLNGDGNDELFVMLLSSYYCGSGGCTWYIFNPDGSILTRGSVAGYPVYVGEAGSEGYRTLYIRSGGAFHTLEYSNGAYPSNPSTQPTIQLFSDPGYTRASAPRILEKAGITSCTF